jgi:hypothetical protein
MRMYIAKKDGRYISGTNATSVDVVVQHAVRRLTGKSLSWTDEWLKLQVKDSTLCVVDIEVQDIKEVTV